MSANIIQFDIPSRRYRLRIIRNLVCFQILFVSIFAITLYIFLRSELASDLASAHTTFRNVSESLRPIIIVVSTTIGALSCGMIALYIRRVSSHMFHQLDQTFFALNHLSSRKIHNITTCELNSTIGNELRETINTIQMDFSAIQTNISAINIAIESGNYTEAKTGLNAIQNVLNSWN